MSTTRYDLYGWREMSLHEASEVISTILNVQFRPHNSDYLGGNYYRTDGPEGDHISIQGNVRDDEGYLVEAQHPEFKTLMYVNGATDTIAERLATLSDLVLLRTETL